ncbi:hypothetical protein MUK42_04348 [Musa troglodytarum]|uniref:Uncharacterized protein n=1 Tax=Musa troglodytarum TaxID=320322 RepID=A0A9E7KF04_9LILI|nr:hypothetical protein MUK42_04348 [Musa troglodytarum]
MQSITVSFSLFFVRVLQQMSDHWTAHILMQSSQNPIPSGVVSDLGRRAANAPLHGDTTASFSIPLSFDYAHRLQASAALCRFQLDWDVYFMLSNLRRLVFSLEYEPHKTRARH